jgi:hypothetical protein
VANLLAGNRDRRDIAAAAILMAPRQIFPRRPGTSPSRRIEEARRVWRELEINPQYTLKIITPGSL